MHGLGVKFLTQSFDILATQTFKDFEVVISDHSKDNAIKNLCATYAGILNIQYYRNPNGIGNSSANINNAIKLANGKLIKILLQDDFLYTNTALEEIVQNFDINKDGWLITACEHTLDGIHFFRPFYPKYHDKIHMGRNTISSPSVLTIRNESPLLFDENLLQRTDGDYYKRCHNRFGEPKILNTITVVNRAGPHQVSNTMITDTLRDDEFRYILKKHNEKFPIILIFSMKVRKYISHLKKLIRKII